MVSPQAMVCRVEQAEKRVTLIVALESASRSVGHVIGATYVFIQQRSRVVPSEEVDISKPLFAQKLLRHRVDGVEVKVLRGLGIRHRQEST